MSGAPDTMHAVVLTGHGGFDRLVFTESHLTPKPGPGEVLVRVGACGLNNTDINTRTAWYAETVRDGITDEGGRRGYGEAQAAHGSWGRDPIAFPRIQGADVVGVIAATGPGVAPAREGERILIDAWLLDPDDPRDPTKARYFGSEVDGGFAQYAVVPASNAHRIDSALHDAELATFPCAYTTAENLLERADLGAGETVVVTGASGGVGSAAIQLARIRGARIIAIAAVAKAGSLLDLGAAAVVDRDEPDLEAAIRDAASGAAVDVAIDVVGGPTFTPLIKALRQGGRYSSAGAISGPVVEFDLRLLIYKDLQLTGATVVPSGTFARLVQHIESGRLRPLLAATYPLRDLAEAQAAFLAKRHVGNIVVDPFRVGPNQLPDS